MKSGFYAKTQAEELKIPGCIGRRFRCLTEMSPAGFMWRVNKER
jgi:hypothetical protein